MKLQSIILTSVLAGLIGGLMAGIFFLTLATAPWRATSATVLPVIARRGGVLEFPLIQIMGSMVALVKPAVAEAEYVSPREVIGAGVAVTADGLLFSSMTIKSARGILGVAAEGSPFAIKVAQGKNGRPIVFSGMGFSLLQAVPDQKTPRLKAVTLAALEDLTIGQALVAVNAQKQISWHHIRALAGADSRTALSADVPQDVRFRVDGEPEKGAFLFDGEGRLAGVVVAQGEAAPAEWMATVMRQFLKEGQYRPTTLGVNFADLNQLIALQEEVSAFGLRLEGDRQRLAVAPNSPAEKAGLRAGDVLTVFDGRRLDGAIPLPILLQRYSPGTEVEVVFLRQGREEKTKVVLGPQ